MEGGPYPPPASVQYAIRAVRFGQLGAAVAYFFGEQICGSLRLRPPSLLQRMHENPLVAVGGVYGLDVIAQTMKSINAFEITYNGRVLHSKLQTGSFPDLQELAAKLLRAKTEDASAVAKSDEEDI